MANRCEYKVIVKGKKNACYAYYGSMRVLENKWITGEEGPEQAYTLRFEGDCKWSVDYECNPWNGETPVALPDDPQEAQREAEGKFWSITVQDRSRMFGVEVWCNSADVEYDPDEPEECFEHYICGVYQACECPDELRIAGDGPVYDEETGEWMDRDEWEQPERERRPLEGPLTVELAGTQHEGRSGRIERVKQGDLVRLVREMDNPYDEYAIDVVSEEGSLGHIPGAYTARLARQMEKGTLSAQARVAEVTPLSQCSKQSRKALISVTVYPADWQESAPAVSQAPAVSEELAEPQAPAEPKTQEKPKRRRASGMDTAVNPEKAAKRSEAKEAESSAGVTATAQPQPATGPKPRWVTINDDFVIPVPDGMVYSTNRLFIHEDRTLVMYKKSMNAYYRSQGHDENEFDFSGPFSAPQCLTMMNVIPWEQIGADAMEWYNPETIENLKQSAEALLRRLPVSGTSFEFVVVKARSELIVCYARNGEFNTWYIILGAKGIYNGQLWVNDTPDLQESYCIMEGLLRGIEREADFSYDDESALYSANPPAAQMASGITVASATQATSQATSPAWQTASSEQEGYGRRTQVMQESHADAAASRTQSVEEAHKERIRALRQELREQRAIVDANRFAFFGKKAAKKRAAKKKIREIVAELRDLRK